MDRDALILSLKLAAWTLVMLLPVGVILGRILAWHRFPGKSLIEAALALPLVLPPPVLGYYMLVALGSASPLGKLYESITGQQLVFTFS